MLRFVGLCLGAVLAVAGPALAGVPAPKVSISSYSELATPLPYPYDEAADADAQLAKGLAQAKAQHKRLMLKLGGNWCGDCRVLAATMDLPEMKAFMNKYFVLVEIDVGRFNKNLQVPARYGITNRLEGVPSILVVDPKTDKLLNPGTVSSLSDARHMSPQALADWLAQWAR